MHHKRYKVTRILMGMPIAVEIVGEHVPKKIFDTVYNLFAAVDTRYSPFKPESEVSRINAGLPQSAWSREMQHIMALCEQTKQETDGYFDAYNQGRFDPSGIVKGWAIQRAAELLLASGYDNFYIEAGGDIAAYGCNAEGVPWRIGIRNPFNRQEVIKVLHIQNKGVATSGAYIRGDHIYNPHTPGSVPKGVASITVIGPDVYNADRFATAAYAMGRRGITFVEALDEFEAYMVAPDHIATMTTHLERYVA